jgi:pyridoxal phosphate enzyme (YggS family)
MSDAHLLENVKQHIAAAARDAGRRPEDVELIAVSKTFEAADIRTILEAGHRTFGENRVQEAAGKWPGLRNDFEGIELHLIGPLQSNKTRQAVELFDVIHTVDRKKIADTIAKEIEAQKKPLRLFIQVNTGEEPQKAGINPAETGSFVTYCRDELSLPIHGLMCIPPVDEEPGIHFALLGALAAANGLKELSMGMSADYEIAIRFGATAVRVGSAIFGARG